MTLPDPSITTAKGEITMELDDNTHPEEPEDPSLKGALVDVQGLEEEVLEEMEAPMTDEDDSSEVKESEEQSVRLTGRISEEELGRKGFVSSVNWENTSADCVVICCSDPRFEKQNENFVQTLGFSQPHFIQIPSGLAVFTALVAVSGFLHKGMQLLLKKAIELTEVKTVICIGHEDCGGYRVGRTNIVQAVSRRFSHRSVRELQLDHLQKSGRTVSRQLGRDVSVRVFYADVVNLDGVQRVKYTELEFNRRGR